MHQLFNFKRQMTALTSLLSHTNLHSQESTNIASLSLPSATSATSAVRSLP